MISAVLSFEERKSIYRTAEGQERACFTGIPDWLYAYMPKLKRGCGWELLSLILHHQRMGQRNRPIAISLTQFHRETGRAMRTIQKGLSDLARAGLLYEELETPDRQDSAIRYAIVGKKQVGKAPTPQADESLVVHLLDGPYAADPLRLITRAGVVVTSTPQNNVKQGVGVVETSTQGCEKRPSRAVRNCITWVAETAIPPAPEARREMVSAASLDFVEKKKYDKGERCSQQTPLLSASDSGKTRQLLAQTTRSLENRTLASPSDHNARGLLRETVSLQRGLPNSSGWEETAREPARPAPGVMPEAPLDYGEKRDTRDPLTPEETPFSGAPHPSPGLPPLFAAADTGNHHPAAPTEPAPRRERKRDPLWETAVELFHQPMGGELKDWRYNLVPELHRQGISPEQLQHAAERYKREHPTWNYSFKAVFNHLGELLQSSRSVPGPTLAAAYQYAPAVPAYMRPGKGAR